MIQRDPIGYRGGLNLYLNCRNTIVTHVDPKGEVSLKITTVSGPTPGQCGQVEFSVKWTIDPRAEETGYIIQEVYFYYCVHKCGKSSDKDCKDYHYAEAWHVLKNSSTSYEEESEDHFNFEQQADCTFGGAGWWGSAGWHPGYKDAGTWKTDKNHPSRGLPYVDIPPGPKNPYDAKNNTVKHSLGIYWDCCKYNYINPSKQTVIKEHTP